MSLRITQRAKLTNRLLTEFPEGSDVLGFDRVTYLGFMENNEANIPAITLSEGFREGVVFTLHGGEISTNFWRDRNVITFFPLYRGVMTCACLLCISELATYFGVSPQGAVVTVVLQEPIPEQSIPANRIILLEIQASAPEAMIAQATIVVEVMADGATTVVELIFAQTFYSGSYNSVTGLTLPTPLSLIQGYDTDVVFDLEGGECALENDYSVTVLVYLSNS